MWSLPGSPVRWPWGCVNGGGCRPSACSVRLPDLLSVLPAGGKDDPSPLWGRAAVGGSCDLDRPLHDDSRQPPRRSHIEIGKEQGFPYKLQKEDERRWPLYL